MTIDPKWKVMNDLEEAFSQITTFDFLLTQLQEAVDSNNHQKIVDTTHALNAFYSPYTDNWDKKFKRAWKEIVKKNNDDWEKYWKDNPEWEEYWNKEAEK